MDEIKSTVKAWNMDEELSEYKDIVPGDEINQRAAMSAAYSEMGEAMAKEIRQDQQYKEDTKKFVKQAGSMEVLERVGASTVDRAVAGVGSYFIVKIIYWFAHPIPGMRQSKIATIIFGTTSALIFVIFCLAIANLFLHFY